MKETLGDSKSVQSLVETDVDQRSSEAQSLSVEPATNDKAKPTRTRIPDPHCVRCDGVGWYEGGATIKTDCSCLRVVSMEDAEAFVINGSIGDWQELYEHASDDVFDSQSRKPYWTHGEPRSGSE